MAVPVLAVTTIALGLRDRRSRRVRVARWTLPIWRDVSFTGVAVSLLLYDAFAADEFVFRLRTR